MNDIQSITHQKIVNDEMLTSEVHRRQQNGEYAVFTNGCFDLLHLGHINYLMQARDLGDFLVVALNADESVRQLKGLGRPLVPAQERAQMLAALLCIDYVTIFEDLTAGPLLDLLRPAIYVKGGDYAGARDSMPDVTRLPEAQHVLAYGGTIRLLPYLPHHSTTELITRIKQLNIFCKTA